MNLPHLQYFTREEFGDWLFYMSPRLLVMLDVFRHRWHAPVAISPVDGALGRHAGDSTTQHNVDVYGEVRAADLLPNGMDTREDMERAIRLAQSLGFTGIGIYPDWKPSPGLHLDVRHEKKPGHPAIWGAVKTREGQKYVSPVVALERAT